MKPIPLLILETCGYSIPIDYRVTVRDQQCIEVPVLASSGVLEKQGYTYVHGNDVSVSRLAHLATLQGSATLIRKILDLDPLDLTDNQHMFDRWFLSLVAPFNPEIASLLKEYFNSYQTVAARRPFQIDHLREEFQQPPNESNKMQRLYFLIFICSYGRAEIVQQLDIAALTEDELGFMLLHASQGSNPELFDLLMSYSSNYLRADLIHTPLVRGKLASDPTFLDTFYKSLYCRPGSLQNTLFDDGHTVSALLLPISQPLPEYVRCLVLGEVRRFGTSLSATGEEIVSLIYNGIVQYWQSKAPAAHLLQDLYFYDILRLLVRSPACEPYLDKSSSKHLRPLIYVTNKSNGYKVFPYPSVEGYSALMLALHCGMKPAVQILVDAGVSISKLMCCGKSALSLAHENIQSQHPRRWVVCYDATSGATIPVPFRVMTPEMDVSEDTDKDMLEILLKALRDRGEAESRGSNELPMPSRWSMALFISWLRANNC